MTVLPFLVFAAIGGVQTPASRDLIDLQTVRLQEFRKVRAIRDRIREQDPKAGEYPPSLVTDPTIRSMGLASSEGASSLQMALTVPYDRGTLTDFHPLDVSSKDPVLNYTTAGFTDKGDPKFITLKTALHDRKLMMYKVKVTKTPLPTPGKPAGPAESSDQFMGVFTREDAIQADCALCARHRAQSNIQGDA